MEETTQEMPRGEMNTSTASTQNMGELFRATAKQEIHGSQAAPNIAEPTMQRAESRSSEGRMLRQESGASEGRMPGEERRGEESHVPAGKMPGE
jgi:hypothetical protein